MFFNDYDLYDVLKMKVLYDGVELFILGVRCDPQPWYTLYGYVSMPRTSEYNSCLQLDSKGIFIQNFNKFLYL